MFVPRSTQIKTYSWDNAQVLLVGNKCDMEDERVVNAERGRQLSEHLGELNTPLSLLNVGINVMVFSFKGAFEAVKNDTTDISEFKKKKKLGTQVSIFNIRIAQI